MTKPPIKKISQSEYVKTALRLPPDLHAALHADADRAGRSLNAEILARLQENQSVQLAAELASIKLALRKILDAVT
jgi:predicted HicB family RNase H-like nuclease